MGPSTATTTDSRVFLRVGEVVARAVGDETILVPIRGKVGDLDSVFTLSSVGARVWSLIDGKRDVTAIARLISEEYEVDEEVAASDVSAFLDTLIDALLIREEAR